MQQSVCGEGWVLRQAKVEDQPGIIALISACYGEYGDKICLEDADSDLLAVPEHYVNMGGDFVVLVQGEQVIGTHAVHPIQGKEGVFTFRRLYLDAAYRGTTKAGHELFQWAIDTSRSLGAKRIEFWSDTRFTRAHRFFEKFAFKTTGERRTMTDAWDPYDEFFFYLDMVRS